MERAKRADAVKFIRRCSVDFCQHFEERLAQAQTYFQCVEQFAELLTQPDDVEHLKELAPQLNDRGRVMMLQATTYMECISALVQVMYDEDGHCADEFIDAEPEGSAVNL